jgi:hypothetical protein
MFVLCWYLLVKVIALVTVEFPIEVFVSDVEFFTIAFFYGLDCQAGCFFLPIGSRTLRLTPLEPFFIGTNEPNHAEKTIKSCGRMHQIMRSSWPTCLRRF